MSDESKVRILDKIAAKQRAPPGPFDKGYARTIALPGLGHLTKQDVRHRQGPGFCKSDYNATLGTVYEDSWRMAVFLCREEFSLPDPATRMPPDPATRMPPDPGEGSSLATQMDVDGVDDGREEEQSGPLTHDEESAIARVGKDRHERQCYTFSVSLNNVIAPPLTEHADIVADLCKATQVALTDMADELFALVMKPPYW
ncbi:MAG: hypothetical protein JOS17DRAFT_10356 [Linnemannia elongata]|nr:MAG: hypothetical protein JOS17DRAFT_10356 [Linnemannia elongata]